MSSGQQSVELPGAYALELAKLVERWDIPSGSLLEVLGETEQALAAPDKRVSVERCAELVDRAKRLTGEPALALHFGMHMRLSSHGFVGLAAMSANTVREALQLAQRFAATRTNAIALALHTEGDSASLVIEERRPLGALREFAIVSLIAELWQAGHALTGQTLAGHAELAFPAPPYIQRIPDPPRSLMRFDQPAHRLVFSASTLDLPLHTADLAAKELARQQCELQLAALIDTGLLGRVRAAIEAAAPDAPALPAVAKSLHMSARTLKRRLAAQGTSFSAVHDDLRRQRALLLISDRSLTLADIATSLGYSETSNFTRAFRRWTGMSPGAYRDEHR